VHGPESLRAPLLMRYEGEIVELEIHRGTLCIKTLAPSEFTSGASLRLVEFVALGRICDAWICSGDLHGHGGKLAIEVAAETRPRWFHQLSDTGSQRPRDIVQAFLSVSESDT
jgi:hypothetical protein